MRHGEPNHTCRICGKPYFACDTCDAKIGKTWRAVTCTAEHYDVFLAMWKYTYGQMSEDGVKEILLNAKANTWVNSPSYDAIIALIGEPKEDDESEEVEGADIPSTENVVYAPDVVEKPAVKKDDNAEHVVVKNAEDEEPLQKEKPASTNVKQNYYNGSNRNKKRHH